MYDYLSCHQFKMIILFIKHKICDFSLYKLLGDYVFENWGYRCSMPQNYWGSLSGMPIGGLSY